MKKVIKTRIAKDAPIVETQLVIDFDGVTPEQLHELAARSIIISTQALYRTSGKIPEMDTVKVADMLTRERTGGGKKATPESLAARVLKMPAEERMAFMRMLENEVAPAPTKPAKVKKSQPAEAVPV